MRTRAFLARVLLLSSLIAAALPAGCSGEVSFTTAKLSEATMCLGVDGENKPLNATSTFGVNTPEIFCSVKLSNAPDETEIGSEWVYVKGELSGYDNTVIDTLVLTANGTQYIQFSMPRPQAGWPVGEYKLNLYINGTEETSLPFTVSKTAPVQGGGSISEVTMALGVDASYRPVDPTTTFRSNTPELFCSINVSGVPVGAEVQSEWYYVSGDWQGVTNRLIGSVPIVTQGTQYVSLSLLAPEGGWPGGQYQVKLYVNGALQEAVPFSVESAPISAVTAMSIDANNNPINPTSTFPVGVEKVYCVIYVHNAPAGTKLLVEWYDIGQTVHRFINKNAEMTVQTSDKPTWASLGGGTGGWKAGSYAVVLSINGERALIVPFTVG